MDFIEFVHYLVRGSGRKRSSRIYVNSISEGNSTHLSSLVPSDDSFIVMS